MTFEAYARDWLERQNFSKNIRKTTRQSIDYICRAIGPIETSDVAESDVDRIFTDVQLFNRQIDFMRCISLRREGDSWDFKRQWHDKEKEKSDLLHDIICMSNLVQDEDGLSPIRSTNVLSRINYKTVEMEGHSGASLREQLRLQSCSTNSDKNMMNTDDVYPTHSIIYTS